LSTAGRAAFILLNGGARFDVFSRCRTRCIARLAGNGYPAHEQRYDCSECQSTDGHFFLRCLERLVDPASFRQPGSWTGCWKQWKTLHAPRVVQIRHDRGGRLSKSEHSQRPGVKSKVARNETRSRDAYLSLSVSLKISYAAYHPIGDLAVCPVHLELP
jgi:hypothetical protein